MIPINKHKLLFYSRIAGLILSIFFLLYFMFRESALRYAFKAISRKALTSRNIQISVSDLKFNGLKTLVFSDLLIVSAKDTLFCADSMRVNPRLSVLFGSKRLRSFYLNNAKVNIKAEYLWRAEGIFFKVNSDTANVLTASKDEANIDFANLIYSLINKATSLIPARVDVLNTKVIYTNANLFTEFYCESFHFKSRHYAASLFFRDNKDKQKIMLEGTIDTRNRNFNLVLRKIEGKTFLVPYIEPRWDARLGFDSLSMSFHYSKIKNGKITLDGSAYAVNFFVKQKAVSPYNVLFKKGSINFNILAGSNFLELDSSSLLSFNGFSFNPYLRFEKENKVHLKIAIPRKDFVASTLFDALPEGLFTSFKGLKTTGDLSYRLFFDVDFGNPDNLIFISEMKNKGMRIQHFGNANLRMLNDTFTHQVFDKGELVREIFVSPSNPSYLKLEDISPLLRYCVLTSEDGSFFYHNGFNEDAFRSSIITNIKQKRFARGGSTITMQLVKNTFLNRNKTISRKVEEILIVWLIENYRLVSKERMFEVYLNIIEWGPSIYGIKEASEFYFKKSPSALNLSESVFLASIIPSPKRFMYSFKDGVLRESHNSYYQLLIGHMLHRNQIGQSDTFGVNPFISLKGRATDFIKADTIVSNDSLLIDNPFQIIEIFSTPENIE